MAQKKLRTARATGAALGSVKATMPDRFEYNPALFLRQAEIDPVVILAARSGVAAATIRAQVEAWNIAGCR